MPRSQKPRKRGRIGRKEAGVRKLIKNPTPETLEAVMASTEGIFRKEKIGRSKILQLMQTVDGEFLTDAHLREAFALERIAKTKDVSDFNKVTSSLAIATLLTDKLDLTPECYKEYNDVLSFACFMVVQIVRLRNFGHEVPEANLDVVADGLAAAQELSRYAYTHNRKDWLDVINYNRWTTEGEEALARDKRVLGKYWERVLEWHIADEARFANDDTRIFRLPKG